MSKFNIDDVEYSRIMRRIGIADGGRTRRSPPSIPRSKPALTGTAGSPALPAVRPQGAQPLRPGLRSLLRLRARRQSWRGAPEGHLTSETVAKAASASPSMPGSTRLPGCASSCTAASRCWRALPAGARSPGSCAARSRPSARSTCASTPTGCGSTRSSARSSWPSGSRSASRSTAIAPPTTCTAATADGRSSYDQVIRAVGLLAPTGTGSSTRGCCARSTSAATRSRSTARWRRSSRRGGLPAPARHLGRPAAGEPAPVDDAVRATGSPAVFDRWARRRRPRSGADVRVDHPRPRAAAAALTEALGLEPSDVVVIETDGTIEQADSHQGRLRRRARHRARHLQPPARRAAAHPAIKARQQGIAGAERCLPSLPGRRQLRRRAVRPPLPDRKRLR